MQLRRESGSWGIEQVRKNSRGHPLLKILQNFIDKIFFRNLKNFNPIFVYNRNKKIQNYHFITLLLFKKKM